MRKAVICGLLALGLTGCASEYTPSGFERAKGAEHLGLEICDSRASTGEIHNATELATCYFPVERQAFEAGGSQAAALFDSYQSRLLLLASDVDAGRLPPDQFGVRYKALNQEYGTSITQIQAADNIRNAQTFQAIGAFGAAMRGAAASYQSAAPQPPPAYQPMPMPSPPVNCRTVYVGNVANTQCF